MEISDVGQQAVARLSVALDKIKDNQQASDLIAILLLATAPLDALNPIEEALLAGFAQRADITGPIASDEAAKRIAAYFAKNPLPNDVAKDVSGVLRDLLAVNNAEKAVAALGKAATAADRVPVEQRQADPGALRMGVMGRFAFDPKKK
jgi:hypothetical protein